MNDHEKGCGNCMSCVAAEMGAEVDKYMNAYVPPSKVDELQQVVKDASYAMSRCFAVVGMLYGASVAESKNSKTEHELLVMEAAVRSILRGCTTVEGCAVVLSVAADYILHIGGMLELGRREIEKGEVN